MITEHCHEWKIDDSFPTFDTLPVHYALFCECGAHACGNPNEGKVHDIVEAEGMATTPPQPPTP